MSYYDNVKDSVKDQEESAKPDASFDTLKEAAQEDSSTEQESNDTPIEVLEEGGLKKKSRERNSKESSGGNSSSQAQSTGNPERTESRDSTVKDSDIEQKLDRMIEQNKRIIEILESFRS